MYYNNQKLKNIKFFIEFIRCFPHLVIFNLNKNKSIIKADITRSMEILNVKYSIPGGLIYLLSFQKPFRNLFYYRIGDLKYILNLFCPQLTSLVIQTPIIGEGFFIWHGISTTIGAKSIGKNCTINQQVTIGNNDGYPTILDNVRIHAGAIIVGDITIGNNVTIGANTTVYKDVPENCTVFNESSRVLKWKTT